MIKPPKGIYRKKVALSLTIPPFIAERHTKSLFQMMVGSVFLGASFTIGGLWLSYAFNLTSGASIILVAGAVFLLFLPLERMARRRRSWEAGGKSRPGIR